jgi:hypothetical protein
MVSKKFLEKVLTFTYFCSNINYYEGTYITHARHRYIYMEGTIGMNRRRPGRGPKISNEVRRLIIGEAIHDSKNMPRRALAVRLQDLIEKMGEISPTEDTLAKMISEARNKQPSELDRPWSIGACTQYNIPPDIIPILISLQKLKASDGKEGMSGKVTIREAKWVTRLYPVAEPVINKAFTNNDGRLWLLSLIVSSYVQRERVSEQMNEQYPDTSDLDRLYFASDNLLSDDSLAAWWGTFPPKYQQAVADVLEPYHQRAFKEFEQANGGPLTDEEIKLIDQCFEVAKTSGPIVLREWVKQHPLAQRFHMADLDWGTIYSEAIKEGLE